MAYKLIETVSSHFTTEVLASSTHHGDDTLLVEAQAWYPIHAFLRDDPSSDMQMLVDLTAVDYPSRSPRFEVVTHLMSLRLGHRLRVKTRVGKLDGTDAEVDSLTALWASANWSERECFDLMGVRFRGHPDLRRILLYPEFEGHPLRKDYPAELTQPLLPYRDVPNIDKLPPFGPYEGMSFGRQVHHRPLVKDTDKD